MMGSPYYYEVHFDPIDVVFHDCMWSGTCCIQLVQQPEKVVQQQAQHQHHHQAERIVLQHHQQQQQPEVILQQHNLDDHGEQDDIDQLPSQSRESPEVSVTRRKLKSQEASSREHSTIVSSNNNNNGHGHIHSTTHMHRKQQQRAANCRHIVQRKGSSCDSKKLRHREVEKNRHRQLQAMVKTLSDRIPGKIDKETQVQTMRRAAKYCLYLRDVLSHGPAISREKLERIYSKSCENVDLLMAND